MTDPTFDDALASVEANAPTGWIVAADRQVRALADTGRPFTADDLWDALEDRPPEPRALGAVLARLSRRGVIVRAGEVKSRLRRGRCTLWTGTAEPDYEVSEPGSSVIHIAGPVIEIGPQYRQRCSWCGAVLLDYDLTTIAVALTPGEPPPGPDWRPAAWPTGGLVEVHGAGGVVSTVDHTDGDVLPVNACGRLPHDVTGARPAG